jgi:cysteine synthase
MQNGCIFMKNNVLGSIGNTPLVLLRRYSSKYVKIFAKLEGANPAGSIKDRISLFMIKDALERKILQRGMEIIEATSGNTGIGLAMISSVLGFRFTAVMPESVSVERRKLLTMYGAQILLTDGTKGTDYAYQYTKDLVLSKKRKYILLNQFENKANVRAHYETTGREIISQLPQVTHFVAGMGTGGTLMGVGQRLKEYKPGIKIIGIEPNKGSKIQGLRNMGNFNPRIYQERKLDNKINIEDEEAFYFARDLFKKEGISVGISSGAALWGALEIAGNIIKNSQGQDSSKNNNNDNANQTIEKKQKNNNREKKDNRYDKTYYIVTVFPDRGDRYISTALFS